jgi:hypothetical protein
MKFATVVTATLFILLLPASPVLADCGEGAYSRAAHVPNASGSDEFPSPDGEKTIVLRWNNDQPKVFVRVKGKEYSVPFSPWPCPEFQWSPDSQAFFVTFSDGGAVGTYKTLVVSPFAQSVQITDPTAAVEKEFLAHYPKCFDPETPNLAAVSWQGDSTRLLLAAQVLPHSNCEMMGTFSLYEIEAPSGKIQKKFGQLAAKRAFGGLLGAELRNADDECFTKVGACEIPQLHGRRE